MSKEQETIKGDLLDSLLGTIERIEGKKNLIAFPRVLVDFTGSIDAAIFLSQMIYWSDRAVRDDGGVFKTYTELEKEIGLSEFEVKSSVRTLSEMKILETKLKKANGAPTVHYYLNRRALKPSIEKFLRNRKNGSRNQEKVEDGLQTNSEIESGESGESLTDITTEITTELTSNNTHSFSKKIIFVVDETGVVDTRNVPLPILHFFANTDPEHNSTGYALETACRLPINFSPTWEKQFRASQEFPNVSPSYVTKKFTAFYKDKDMEKTLFEWNQKWWDWMVTEKPHYTRLDAIREEHLDIYADIAMKFFGLFDFLGANVLHRDTFLKYFASVFSGETVNQMLEKLVEYDSFKGCNGHYFDADKYEESKEWKHEVDKELLALDIHVSTSAPFTFTHTSAGLSETSGRQAD